MPRNSVSALRTMAAPVALVACAILAIVPSVVAEEAKISEAPITEYDREHWAFQPLVRPEVPDVEDRDWPQTPIDRFILAELERKDLPPQPPAPREALIRRLTFDLTGLPPTPDEIDAFVADDSPHAYERLVDRLLASPAYGERWAQHWLDLARFAETDGFEHDKVRPEAWRYRDWVIDALNRDMPYDRFVQWQLAGDELAPGDPQARIATMFCLAGPDMPDINSQEERKHTLLNEMTATVGSALMGLQLGCAQCHDHKYDPVSQADFYRLRAVFEPAVHVKKNESVGTLDERPGDVPNSYVMLRGDWRRRGPEVSPDFVRIANPWNDDFADVVETHVGGTTGRRAALARWLTRPDHPLTARVMANRVWQHHFGQGLCRTPSDFGLMGAEPWHGKLLDWLATELVDSGWSLKRLHRTILLSSVYRQGTEAESGKRKAELTNGNRKSKIENQKSLDTHSAIRNPQSVDPANELLWRFPRRRLEGELIRDAMLAASDSLDRRAGGPGVMPPLPEELVATLLRDQWKESDNPADHYRRSIYVFARRNLRYPIFEAFDRPDANASCPRREQSTIAPQALLLLNGQFSLDAAQRLAGYVLARTTTPDEQVTLAFRRTLGRRPSEEELSDCRRFLDGQAKRLRDEGRRPTDLALPIPLNREHDPHAAAAMTDLCLALFNTNEFLYLD